MNFLGVGPGEIVLILIVLLVVVGPERLPELSRQAGRLLVRGRDWFQNKPEMELMMRARQELEDELAAIRAGLREVQLVRDEVVGTARQLTDSVNPLVAARPNFTELIKAPAAAGQDEAEIGEPIPSSIRTEQTDEPNEPDAWDGQPGQPSATAELAQMSAFPSSQLENLSIQIQAIMIDLRALQQQLQQQGTLDSDWTPPSHGISLPDHPTAPPAPQPEEVA
jgi:Sec-independent protein translocase protein TatA